MLAYFFIGVADHVPRLAACPVTKIPFDALEGLIDDGRKRKREWDWAKTAIHFSAGASLDHEIDKGRGSRLERSTTIGQKGEHIPEPTIVSIGIIRWTGQMSEEDYGCKR
jgi:hypothetical protein